MTCGGVQTLQHSHSLLTAVEAHWDLKRGRGVYSRLLLDCAEVNKRSTGASRQVRPGYGGLRGKMLLLRFALLVAARAFPDPH